MITNDSPKIPLKEYLDNDLIQFNPATSSIEQEIFKKIETEVAAKITSETVNSLSPGECVSFIQELNAKYCTDYDPNSVANLQNKIAATVQSRVFISSSSENSSNILSSTLENEFYPFEQLTDFVSFLSQPFINLGISLGSITLAGLVTLFLTFLKLNKNGYIFTSSLAIQVYTTTFKNFFHSGILKKSLHQRLRDFLLFTFRK